MNKIHRLVANISFSSKVGLYVYITTIFLQKEWTKYADICTKLHFLSSAAFATS